jgi:hypothetical protein
LRCGAKVESNAVRQLDAVLRPRRRVESCAASGKGLPEWRRPRWWRRRQRRGAIAILIGIADCRSDGMDHKAGLAKCRCALCVDVDADWLAARVGQLPWENCVAPVGGDPGRDALRADGLPMRSECADSPLTPAPVFTALMATIEDAQRRGGVGAALDGLGTRSSGANSVQAGKRGRWWRWRW